MNPAVMHAPRSAMFSLLALVLLIISLLEPGVRVWNVFTDGIEPNTLTILSAPVSWALWITVVLTVCSNSIHQAVRYIVALGALIGGAVSAGLYVLALRSPLSGGEPLTNILTAALPLGLPLVLTLWAIVDVIRRRRPQTLTAPPPTAQHALEAVLPPPAAEQPRMAQSADQRQVPTSPTTPVARRSTASGQSPSTQTGEAQWRKVTSPWPRAVEDDPDGTLLRPPRRRSQS